MKEKVEMFPFGKFTKKELEELSEEAMRLYEEREQAQDEYYRDMKNFKP